jgi:translation initiation factor 3 subunit B
VKIEGAMDFEWSPATVAREGVKQYEQLLCFWTPVNLDTDVGTL